MKKDLKILEQVPAVKEELEEVAREGARRLLREAMEEEVEEFLGRKRYERREENRGYRNGYGKARSIAMGMGSIKVCPPRVSDVREGDCFRSKILSRYQRTSMTTKALLANLYLEGLSSGDFEPVFRVLLGETAPLSASSILCLKQRWQGEYETWKGRSLKSQYAYCWADGVYLKAGCEEEKTALLVVLGVNEEGKKELLAIEEGYRETSESWGELLRNLRKRGVEEIGLLIGDGNLGLWSALREVFPKAKEQRCWNHKALNVMDKLPKRLQKEVRGSLGDIWGAPTEAECRRRAEAYVERLKKEGQEKAAECVMRDWDQLVTFYQFPKAHWKHLRTTNPIESVFAGTRLRTNVTKRMKSQKAGLYLVWKLIQRLSENWQEIEGKEWIQAVLSGKRFKDGVIEEEKMEEREVKKER